MGLPIVAVGDWFEWKIPEAQGGMQLFAIASEPVSRVFAGW